MSSSRGVWVLSPVQRNARSSIRFLGPMNPVDILLVTLLWFSHAPSSRFSTNSNGDLLHFVVKSSTSSTDSNVGNLMLLLAYIARILCYFS